MKAFVTGGTGFVGYNLIRELLAQQWQVIALHREKSNLRDLKALGVQLVQGSITDPDSLDKAVPQNIDAIFHVAGNINQWVRNNDAQTKDNVGGTANMVNVALKKKAKRFIQTSTIMVYGLQPKIATEHSRKNGEFSWVNYFASKFQAEQQVYKGIEQGLDAVIVNPGNIMGPFDVAGWAQFFTLINDDNFPGAPCGKGSFCHVQEVARAQIKAFEQGKTGENYLLGGQNISHLALVQKIQKLLNKKTSQHAVPKTVMKALGRVSQWYSYISNKEPVVTPEKAFMLTGDYLMDSSKSIETLDYKIIPVEQILQDCHDWLKQENLI